MNACSMTLMQAAKAVDAQPIENELLFNGVSTDTRSISDGSLFVAIKGENFDAHDFVADAARQGAVAAIVSRNIETTIPLILVHDTRIALGKLASSWASQFSIPFIAVTGSNGKTTVKEMIASILSVQGNPLVTRGNLNNDIGVPLTLLRLEKQHSHAVIEMGASHAGEIAWLAEIVQPDVAVVNNAMPAHLEGFGDVEGVARAKGELFEALADESFAIINADDDYADYWQGITAHCQRLTFGFSPHANVTARLIEDQTEAGTIFMLVTPQGEAEVHLPLPGRHNVMNALAAATVSIALYVSLNVIREGLQRMQGVAGRLQVEQGIANARVINDTYNANPASLKAALDVLARLDGKRIFVMGDMAELGAQAEEMHAEAGAQAKAAGVELLYALGPHSRAAVKAFGQGASHFDTHADLINALEMILDADSIVLVKGSRAMQMERVTKAVLKPAEVH
jgi:UDP-N-acetylmuramoyl-tripeptide--D-alanyl-D-alanine ligase